ncbi:MAG: flagellar biosynthesis protein FliR [Peptococcaceae bacterium BICA1-7]|nr:MAG: flagellar biosynthesis protein FliR [Peptococcaceae bacterium BICA1-7]HBV96615.1 flagellar type III secretion system protein FliR [Desulfotomaculum sp.]
MINLELVASFLLVFARISAFVASSPIFGGQYTTAIVKAGITFVITVVLYPLVSTPEQLDISGLGEYATALVREVGVGLLMGFLCSLILHALSILGQLFDLHIGFMMTSIFDQSVGGMITLTAKFLYLTGIILFFVLDGHHMLLLGLARSFDIVPLNTAVLSGTSAEIVIKAFARMITVAVQLSAPFIAVILIIDVCLGILGRTAPQMNIFMMGFPIKIIAGIVVLAVMAPLLGTAFQSLFRMMERDLYTLLKGLINSG